MTPQEFIDQYQNLLDASHAAVRELERSLQSLCDEARASNISCDTCAHSCVTHIIRCKEYCDNDGYMSRPCFDYTPETPFTAQIRGLHPPQELVDEIIAAWEKYCPIAKLPEHLQAPLVEIIRLVYRQNKSESE